MALRLHSCFKQLTFCSRTKCSLFLLVFFVTSCWAVIGDDDETNYVKLLLRDLDSSSGVQEQQLNEKVVDGKDSVKRHWGISDATAVVGKVFSYPIPEDAFSGRIQKFEVTEAGESNLPEWLQYDEDSQTFSGVPLSKDMGQYYISVKAIGYSPNKSPSAKDVFSIEVVEDSSESRLGDNEGMIGSCASGESQTIANLVLDLNLDELNISDRLSTLKKLSSFLNMPVKKFKLLPKTDENSVNLNAVLAGPGNAKTITKKGAVIEWRIGCSMSISTEQKAMITKLENAAADASLSNAIGYPVIGWHITNVFPKVYFREKRQVNRGTPVPGVVPTQLPRFTEIDEFEITDDTLIPETRIIPTMASPTIMQPSHHHRHGHGDFGMERGHHHHNLIESPALFTSPTLYNHRFQTAHVTPLGATPVIVPVRPTKYVSTTTLVDESVPGRYYPEEHTPLGGLVSSMIIPTPVIGITDALPTQTFVSSVDLMSSEIKPTKSQTVVEKTKKPPGTPNFKPTIEKRMQKLTVIAGKVWKYQIPHDTFVDMEDGDTRHLKLLFLTSERTAVSPTSWIQFDPVKQMLYALPLDEHIGKYEFILEAMDNEGASTNDRLDIHVWQHQSARTKHHEFSVSLKLNKWQYPITIDWNIEFAKRLSAYFGDKNESNIAVQAVTTEPLTTITWSNDTLPTYPCPNDEITDLTNKLIDENSNKISVAFIKAMGQDLKVVDASVNFLGVCRTPVSTTSPTHTNYAPLLRNPIERINTTVGEILRFRIPDDTFYDFEDGSTRYLTLTFLTIENVRPPKSSWVQFDHKSQELYGLPFDGDTGRHEYQLVAMDNNGLQINDVFVIEVHPRPPKKWNVEFSLHIDHDYEEFSKDISKKVLVAWKLAKLYDDPDPRYITIGSISKGSVVYAWTNNTLPHDPCPKRTIDKLVENMINEDGTLSSKLTDAMLPEFKVIKADAMPLGICLGEVTPTSVTIPPPPITEAAEPAVTTDDDIYITTIIPAVVIAVMLIIAALVACFLYRKKRKGKMTMQDNNTFIGNRAPVIFGDEMEEKPDPAKPPVIMREEKPPLAPPDYLRSSVSSRDSTPHLDRVEQANIRNTNADLHTDPSPPYQPPPPFTTNRDSKNSRPKGTPTYRQPPPYMPPVPP
ncbi:dystroglycan 1 [Parasteatoda tepidariorum]|uniref:dystroglycan 1 n=1 Tax=Parasteatoda tepidariorum TaxID=114398 RepID=UPI00077FB844|nr:dystroglycan [Parasteatoda tepidariorum]XP_042895065.1 dystroglycan [Parasteatoda tepidariorum]